VSESVSVVVLEVEVKVEVEVEATRFACFIMSSYTLETSFPLSS
jgi:hypothetical protein